MGARGPAPTPKSELERRGSWRAKDRPDELVTDGSIPNHPASIKGEARAEWKRIVKELGPKRVLGGNLDRGSLTQMCLAWAEAMELHAFAQKLVCGSADWKRVIGVREAVWDRYNRLCTKYGMTALDRPRIKITAPSQNSGAKSRFFGGADAAPVIGKVGA